MGKHPKGSVAFVGLGYVGLSTAVCLADKGIGVIGIDVDEPKVAGIAKGHPPFHEARLTPMMRRALRKGSLRVGTDFEQFREAKIAFITVGTPSLEDGGIDTEYVETASRQIGRQLGKMKGYRLIVVKSTVIPGTTEGTVRSILERESGKRAGRQFGLASNPEFLHEGSAVRETLHPEAVVIGGHDRRSATTLLGLYRTFYGRLPPVVTTTIPNAEMMKYAINSGRAAQVSFVNTVANLCTKVPGCDYDEVRKGLSLIARMDDRYLGAGLGFGGSCLPKDSRALASALRNAGVSDEVLSAAMRINEGQMSESIRLAEKMVGALEGKRVSILGLAFKPGTDDVRESVPIQLARTLVKIGADVTVYDPVAMENTRKVLGAQLTYADSAKSCIRGSECVFIATGWDEFKSLRPKDIRTLMASPVVVDGRRVFDQQRFRKAGVRISVIGTGPPVQDLPRKFGPDKEHVKEWHYVVRDGKVANTPWN